MAKRCPWCQCTVDAHAGTCISLPNGEDLHIDCYFKAQASLKHGIVIVRERAQKILGDCITEAKADGVAYIIPEAKAE